MFINPVVDDVSDFEARLTEPNEDELMQFLVKQKGFQEKTVLAAVKKLRKYAKSLE